MTDELRARLASHFTPQEVMEIVLAIGFWQMYNVMHSAMAVPIEDPVIALALLVALKADAHRGVSDSQIFQRDLRQPIGKMGVNYQDIEGCIGVDAKRRLKQ